MIYEFQCSNHKKPYEFEVTMLLKEANKTPKCPKCNTKKNVKKILKYSVPKSKSWQTF